VSIRANQDFTIGDLSRLTGVNVETIRYYERMGLMPRPPRTLGGHRAFGPEDLRTLAFIKRSRDLDFGLHDIRALLTLRATGVRCVDVKAIASRHLRQVRARLRRLAELELTLAAAVERCPDDASADCSVLELIEGSARRSAA
jgi:MerR family mercuric resistance operon transcriptional regulator